MSEQENHNSMQCSDGLARKKWKRPVIVELSEVNADGAEGKITRVTESTGFFAYGPS